MTSKTSLFNYGIFTNTVKRFKWGSFLYFIFLFFTLPFAIIVDDFNYLISRFLERGYNVPLILTDGYLIFSLLMAMMVPTIAAVLIFHNVHSSKQSVFEHGLPVTRAENYLSNLLSGFTLMLAPLLLISIILIIMSLSGYGQLFSVGDVLYWFLLNSSVIFIMFSIASVTAFLTGHAAAHIGINIFMNVLPLLIALTIWLVCDTFLFGYMQSDATLAAKMMEHTPMVWLFGKPLTSHYEMVNVYAESTMWCFLIGAAVLYGLGFLLYSKRKIEHAGDVAAFKAFRPIFKYMITTATVVILFAMTKVADIDSVYKIIVAAVGAAVTYFACEMLINKTVKVFGSYKGFCVFGILAALFISFFAYTSVFGYETRVPALANVESMSAYTYRSYDEEPPYVTDIEIIKAAQDIHREVIKEAPIVEEYDYQPGEKDLYITYQLKNGKRIDRYYRTSEELYDRAMTAMYNSNDYKMKITGLDNINVENVVDLEINLDSSYHSDHIMESKRERADGRVRVINNSPDIMAAIKKDVEELSYMEMKKSYNWHSMDVRFDINYYDNEKYKVFKEIDTRWYGEDNYEHIVENFDIDINSNFKNTYNVLKESGIYDRMKSKLAENLYLLKIPVTASETEYSYKGERGEAYEFNISLADCVRLDKADGELVAEEIMTGRRNDDLEGNIYCVYAVGYEVEEKSAEILNLASYAIAYTEENLPENLEKFVIK